jgi:hypothetical protein
MPEDNDNGLSRFDIWQFRFEPAIGIMFRRKYIHLAVMKFTEFVFEDGA